MDDRIYFPDGAVVGSGTEGKRIDKGTWSQFRIEEQPDGTMRGEWHRIYSPTDRIAFPPLSLLWRPKP